MKFRQEWEVKLREEPYSHWVPEELSSSTLMGFRRSQMIWVPIPNHPLGSTISLGECEGQAYQAKVVYDAEARRPVWEINKLN